MAPLSRPSHGSPRRRSEGSPASRSIRFGHYDAPPPDTLTDLDALYATGSFRFASRLEAWTDVEDGRIVDFAQSGRSLISSTAMHFGSTTVAFEPTAFAAVTPARVHSDISVTFRRTAWPQRDLCRWIEPYSQNSGGGHRTEDRIGQSANARSRAR